jgi:hypothetical protein
VIKQENYEINKCSVKKLNYFGGGSLTAKAESFLEATGNLIKIAETISSIKSTNTHRKDNLIQAHLYFAIYDLALRVKNYHFKEEKYALELLLRKYGFENVKIAPSKIPFC